MSGLDTRYVVLSYFQKAILDKDTGCPLSGGVIKFFEDEARTTPKNVYQLSGSPPNYTYVSLGSEITLNTAGAIADTGGNDITIYLFPYDASGNIDLYYAEIESSGAVQQFTREGFPNISQAETVEEEVINYVPNPQFLMHHDIAADSVIPVEAGEITEDTTDIAQGGWSFERTASSTAKDFVLFDRIGSYVESPSKSPRYELRVKNEAPGVADVFKFVGLKFRDVNKFASETDVYTFAFQAKSNGAAGSPIDIKIIKNYGTGGTAQEKTLVQTINLTTDFLYYDIPITFGDNDDKTIGPNDDDFIQIIISLPVSSVFDDTFANFTLVKGDKQVDSFQDTTDAQMLRDSMAGWLPVPDYEGQNLYLPVRTGLKGLEYDTDSIGDFVLKSQEQLGTAELWSDGSKYRVDAYSSDRIPYRRLYNKWSENSDYGLAIYGTGDNEMRHVPLTEVDQSFTTTPNTFAGTSSWQSFTAAVSGDLVQIALAFTAISSANPTIFTLYEGDGTGGNILSVCTSDLNLGTTVVFGNRPSLTNGQKYTLEYNCVDSQTIQINSAGGYTGGSFGGGAADAYFETFMAVSTLDYELKSNTGGSVTAAADGSTPTGFTFTPVQPDPYIVKITSVAASAVTSGSFWKYHTTDSRGYIVWYEKDGSGTQPVQSADVYIKVEILSADDAETVNRKTALAINGYSFKVIDTRGYFLRSSSFETQNEVDKDSVHRSDRGDGISANIVGTTQGEEIQAHSHNLPSNQALLNTAGAVTHVGGAFSAAGISSTLNSFGYETRPTNISVNMAVKY